MTVYFLRLTVGINQQNLCLLCFIITTQTLLIYFWAANAFQLLCRILLLVRIVKSLFIIRGYRVRL